MKLFSNNKIALNINHRNRSVFCTKNGIDPKSLAGAILKHTNNVAVIDQQNTHFPLRNIDSLITQKKNIFLSTTAADCLPIFLFDPEKEVIGLVHAGWRGLANNIIPNAVCEMNKLKCLPSDILAGIGPAICEKHYEIGHEVAEIFEKYPEAIKEKNNKLYLDLKKTAKIQLLDSGLREENIEVSPECTFELSEKYFSFRRDLSPTNFKNPEKIKSGDTEKCVNKKLVGDKPQETEAMMAIIGMRK